MKKQIINFEKKFMEKTISKIFYYKTNESDGNINKVKIGNVNIWGLYSNDDNKNELLCALICRCVHTKTDLLNEVNKKSKLMFEVLFLSTYENIRFRNYGRKMVNYIELYCISNCYDIISVAVVPGHGQSFWKSNGFTIKHGAVNNNDKKTWLQQNMLVFDDTPLYSKSVLN